MIPGEVEVEAVSADTDILNTRISSAAIRLLQRMVSDREGSLPTLSSLSEEKKRPIDVISRLQINESALETSLAVRPPCRFEILQQSVQVAKGENLNVHVVLDIAHNVDAIAAFVQKVKLVYPGSKYRLKHFYLLPCTNLVDISLRKYRVVLGMCADKDIEKCLSSVLDLAQLENIHCVAVINIFLQYMVHILILMHY